jgi:hypothetical protein
MTFPPEIPVPPLNFRPGAERLRDVSAILVLLSRFVVLIALPALYFVTASKFVDSRGPFWQGALYDPNYQYLLNSLLLLERQTPGHIDHPGTPVQIVGAALLATKNTLFDRRKNLAKAVIKNPEKYLEFLSSSLRWLFAVSLLLAPLWILIRTSSFSTAIAFQIAPLLHWMTFVEGGVYFKPESLINTLILWFCAWIVTDLIRQSRKSAPGVWTLEKTLAALAAGACVATKMHTAPLLLIALAAAPSLKKALLFGALAAASFLACTIPIFPALPETLNFAFRMASHTQRYGAGKPGIIDPELFWSALCELVSRNWITFILVGLFAVYHALRLRTPSKNKSIRLHLTGLFLAGIQAAFLILVAKHPAHHYLLPLVVSLSLSMALVTYTLNEMAMRWAWVGGLAGASLVALGLVLATVATSAAQASAHRKANIAFHVAVIHSTIAP